MGKSAMALNIAQHVAMKLGKTVMFFSLEMSKKELLHRLLCAVARVDSQRMRHDYLNADERRKVAVATGEIISSKLYIDDKSAASAADLHARIRRQMAKGPVDLVIVDYLQLMSAGKKVDNREREVSEISRGLKFLAAEIHAPVLALAQLNRASELRKGNGRPQLSDLRESGGIEQDADVVVLLHREDYYHRGEQDYQETNSAEIIIAKQRNGPVGELRLTFLRDITRFENYTQ